MAGSQARTRKFPILIPFLMLIPGIFSHYDKVLKEFPTHVFQRHLKVARHNPFCVVFRETGTGSKLEQSIHEIWKKTPSEANYTKWELAAINLDKTKLPLKQTKPEKLPSVRCYLGEMSKYEYKGKVAKAGLRNWLTQLDSLHEEQSQKVTQDLVDEMMSQYHIILLAFPDGPRHHLIEDMMYELAASTDSCKAMAVHLNAPEVTLLRERFGVQKYPSVVVIHIDRPVVNGTTQTVTDHRVFTGLECESRTLKLYVHAKAMDIPLLNLDSLEALLTIKRGPKFRFTPVLVCFYHQFEPSMFSYLDAFNWTVSQYNEDGVDLRYGLIDITQGFMMKLVALYLPEATISRFPFLALFYKGKDGTLKYAEMYTDWPYPWVVQRSLVDIGNGLADLIGLTDYKLPWGSATLDMYSSLSEGPNGTQCTTWSHNMTDNTPRRRKVKVKTIRVIKKPAPVSKEKQWHDMFDTDKLEKKLSVHESIPLLTLETWSDIVEKSHAPRHIFYRSGKWAGEVTKVSLVVFITPDCGNCRRKNETFRDIHKAVSNIDGGAMYYVNCTAERILCKHHNIRGYPILAAYRGLGWMGTSSCLSQNSQKKFKKFVRVDYHGPIMTASVMEWFSRIADNAVTNMKLDKAPKKFETKDVRIVATVLPRTAVAPGSALSEETPTREFSYKCLRLMCERLFGLLDCYTRYSPLIPESAYTAKGVEFYVSKITFERTDGLQATIMKHGKSLHDSLEEEDTNSDVHKFHIAHSYDLDPSMTCEDDPADCTDVMVQFILDHSRMPVTPVTSDMMHTATSSLREETLPILIALVHPENITTSAEFYKTLTAVAYEFYDKLVVMTLNVRYYTVYAASFVPIRYGTKRSFESKDPDPYFMFRYPRLCIIRRDDHTHAALYPPMQRSRRRTDFMLSAITEFVQSYLEDPSSLIIETEKF